MGLRGRIVLAAIACTTWTIGAHDERPLVRVEASRVSMACLYAIEAYGPDPQTLRRTLAEALDEVDRLDRLMSHYRPESPLSRLNRQAAAGPVAVDPELFALIVDARDYGEATGGAFDITVGPLMKAWGFFRGEGRIPPAAALERVRQLVGWGRLRIDRTTGTIAFDRPGVELDLGGIGKGYAVDRAIALLRRRGVTRALVSAGGSSVYGLGAPPGRDAWSIEIQDPIDETKIAFTVALRDRSLSIAGRSEKSFEVKEVRYDHILDPHTGQPAQDVFTVGVLDASATRGDALDTALAVLGVERGRRMLDAYPGTEAFYLVPDARRGWVKR